MIFNFRDRKKRVFSAEISITPFEYIDIYIDSFDFDISTSRFTLAETLLRSTKNIHDNESYSYEHKHSNGKLIRTTSTAVDLSIMVGEFYSHV